MTYTNKNIIFLTNSPNVFQSLIRGILFLKENLKTIRLLVNIILFPIFSFISSVKIIPDKLPLVSSDVFGLYNHEPNIFLISTKFKRFFIVVFAIKYRSLASSFNLMLEYFSLCSVVCSWMALPSIQLHFLFVQAVN